MKISNIYRTLLAFVLLLTAGQQLQAQDAFYVYRNDGEFNGFFYDQVIRMNYSKVDFDGVEHDDYVIQEIETDDSLYRIPLVAIDSIGFQQPEIRFNPKLRHMDELGMTPYLTGVRGMILTFSPSLPVSLRPKVGDVLIGFTGLLEKNGFGGRVVSVWESDFEVEVTCVQLTKMSDIFEQFISVEQVGIDESTNQMCRRVAGYRQLTRGASSDSFTSNLVNISTNLHVPFDTDVGVSTVLDAGVSFKTKLAMTYWIWNDDYWIRAALASDYSLSVGFTLKLSGDGDKTIPLLPGPFNAIKFPAPCPIFEVKVSPSFGIRWAAEASASVQLPVKSGGTCQSFTISSDDPNLVSYSSSSSSASNSMSSFFSESDVNFKLKGTIQAGIKSTIGIGTNSWFEKVFGVSLNTDIWLGPKIEAEVAVDRGFFDEDDGPYTLRNNRFGISPLSLDMEAYASASTLLTGSKHYTFADGSVDLAPNKEFYMFPSFSSFDVNHDEKAGRLVARWEASPRTMFWSSTPGIVVYRKGQPDKFLAADYARSLSFGSVVDDSKELSMSTKDYVPGYYYAAPVLAAFGGVYPVKSMKEQFKVPLYLKVPEKVTASGKGGTITIPAETNGDLRGSNVTEVSTNGFLKREIPVSVTAYAPYDDMEPVTQTVNVVQEGSGEGVSLVTFSIGGRNIDDYGLHFYPGTTHNLRVSVVDKLLTIANSYSGAPVKTEDEHYLGYDVTFGDDSGHTSTIHVPSNESVSWNYNFTVDLNERLNTDALNWWIDEAPDQPETGRVETNPSYTYTKYYLVSDQDKGITEESSGWGSMKAALQTMTLERRYLWSYTSVKYDDFDKPFATDFKIVKTAPVRYKIINGQLNSSVSGTAKYDPYVDDSINNSASVTVTDGYMYMDGVNRGTCSGKAACHLSKNGWSEDLNLDFRLELQ